MTDEPAGEAAARLARRDDLANVQRAFLACVGPARLGEAPDAALAAKLPPAPKLAFYRGGLQFKRLAEVRGQLPHTRALLGSAFDRAFLAFSETSEPRGFARHRADAIDFAATLPHAIARVERASLLAARDAAGFWCARGPRGLVVFVRLRRGARLRRFAIALPRAGSS